jgi:hypothetical protein
MHAASAAMFMFGCVVVVFLSSSLQDLTRGTCETISRQKSDVAMFPAKILPRVRFLVAEGKGLQRHIETDRRQRIQSPAKNASAPSKQRNKNKAAGRDF